MSLTDKEMSYADDGESIVTEYDTEIHPGESPTFMVTDLLSSLGDRNHDPDYLVTRGNDLVVLLQQYSYIRQDLVFTAFGHRIQNLLVHSKKEVVATGFRICRYVISDANSIKSLISLRLDVFIIISLSKGSTHDIEREQAIKLVREFLSTENGYTLITGGIASAILAIAEQIDDKLRKICIETACEISLFRPDLISPSFLIQFILDGPYEISQICTAVLLMHLDSSDTRKYLTKPDILKLISPFTEFPVKGHLNNEKLQNSATVISKILRCWSGIYGFATNDFEPLKDLIACLCYPVTGVVSLLLDLLLDILMINLLNKKSMGTHGNKMVLIPSRPENEFILNNQYRSVLIMALLKCNILDSLVFTLKNSKDESNCTKACFLLTELFSLTSNLVPQNVLAAFVESFPLSDELSSNSNIVFMVEKLTRKSNKGRTNLGLQNVKINDKISQNSKINRNKVNYDIDDNKLKQMINDSRVLTTKSFTKWNCDILSDLFRGPFMNGKRLEEVNKTTKFLKRLLSFYRPFKHKYSGIRRTKQSVRFTKLGCDILETLLMTTEGLKILSESKIIPQIAECLAQVDPYSGFYAKDQIFSKERLDTTLTGGYFKMLGVLSKHAAGIELLTKWKVFSIMHHISDNPLKRDDLIILFMNEMCFKKQGHLRILLSKFLHSESKNIKLSATNLLSKMIYDSECNKLVCEYLVDQLYEQDAEICDIVISILNKYSTESQQNLEQVVTLRPSVDILRLSGQNGTDLLMKFLSIPSGIQFLSSTNFINEEIDSWINHSNYITYVLEVEDLLLKSDRSQDTGPSTSGPIEKEMPLNLFGELVKTEEGLSIIMRSGLLTEFINNVRFYATNIERNVVNFEIDYLKLKACLWSIGFIGTTDYGIETLDVNGCIEDISTIAYKSPQASIKGCALYVLGLISRTSQGIEILDELGWDSTLDILNIPVGLVAPQDLDRFFNTKSHDITEESEEEIREINVDLSEPHNPFFEDERVKKILKLVGNLCNHVFLNTATKDLTSISRTSPDFFEVPELFFKVLEYFQVYKYRYTIRKFVLELFTSSGRLLEVILKRDRRRFREKPVT